MKDRFAFSGVDVSLTLDVPNEQRTSAVKNIVAKMPRENFVVLKFIFAFLTEVLRNFDCPVL